MVKGSTKNGGLLVVRKGWLVYERYFGKGHREATPNLASCGKSVTSIAVGILIAEHPDLFPDGLDQKVFTPRYLPPEAFPLTDPRKKDIKLGQLLSMTAGIRGNNPVYVRGEESTIDPNGPDGWQGLVDAIAFGKKDGSHRPQLVTTRTLWCEPGEGYSYATASIHLASVMLPAPDCPRTAHADSFLAGMSIIWGRASSSFAGTSKPVAASSRSMASHQRPVSCATS